MYAIAGSAPATVNKAEEVRQAFRSMWIAAALSVPVFVLEMDAHMVPANYHAIAATIGQQGSWLIQLTLISLVLAGPRSTVSVCQRC